MAIKKIFLALCVLLSLINIVESKTPADAMFAPPGDFAGFDANMTEEQLISQLMKEIDSALPEDQREAFWEEVARETERLEMETAHMNPAEKEQYLFNLISEETQPIEPMAPQPETEIPVKTPKEPLKQKPPVVSLEKHEEILKLMQQLAKSIESFLSKAVSFPDFDGKVSRWIQKGNITDWKSDSWTQFQHELSKFVNILQRFKEKDISFGFKHLDELIKREDLIQNLKHLHAKLMDYESKIKVNPFEIASMSETTKNAFIHTINALTESLYRTQIPAELQKIIEIFDPIAKQIREQEEKAAKEALTTSQRQAPIVPVRTAGRPEASHDFALPKLEDFGLTGRGIAGGRRSSSEQSPEVKEKGPDSKTNTDKKGEAGDKKAEAAQKAKEAAERKKKEDAEKKKKEEEAKAIKHPDIKKNIEDLFRKDVEDARNAIGKTPEFENNTTLKNYLRPAVPPAA